MTQVLASRSFARAALVVLLVIGVPLVGCTPQDGEAATGSAHLLVVQHNNENLSGVALNAPQVFNFASEVDPLTVNSDTIRIWTLVRGQRVEARGTFATNGATVTWFPDITSRHYPAYVARDLIDASAPILPPDAGLNTTRFGLEYQVEIPSFPAPSTVRTPDGAPLRRAFTATFTTRAATPGAAMESLFSSNAPYFRHKLRVAGVLPYDGLDSRAVALRNWIADPSVTAGENPLMLNPGLLVQARSSWKGREVTGEWIDQILGIQLVPRLTAEDLELNAFPGGVTLRDERLVSNMRGARKGRPREVTGLQLYFTQPVTPSVFLTPEGEPRRHSAAPVQVRVLPDATTDPTLVTPEPYTLTFSNNAGLHAGHLTLRFEKPVRRGWLHITLDPKRIATVTGDTLEGNFEGTFAYLWPARINAD